MMTEKPLRYLLDPYKAWCAAEGIPVIEDFGVDMLTCETGPWPRLGDTCKGAIVNLKGRGDYMSIFVMDLPPGAATAPQRHIYDEVFYVLSGNGSMTVEGADGQSRTFEWGPRSMFAPPLNAHYRIFNASGVEPARLASGNAFPAIYNFFRDERFVFDNVHRFTDRDAPSGFYEGEGEFTAIRPGRHMWETNFVPDLGAFELKPWEARGAGSSNMQFILADGSMGAHVSEMPVGTYKKAHRHAPGLHIFFVHGSGYTLLWYEGDKDFKRVEWRHGMAFAPPDEMIHQHFDTSRQPARYVAIAFGSKRYPIVEARRRGSETKRSDVSIKDGGCQIEYEDQDPCIHALWLAELRKTGVESKMGKFFDEESLSKVAV
jgi:mannose-6-phosphate isomerase-like protein (cupin superfamily)